MLIKTHLILRDPDAPNAATGAPPAVTPPPAHTPAAAPVPETVNPSRSKILSATDALGLDEPPAKSLGAAFDRNKKNLKPSVGLDDIKPPPTPPKEAAPTAPAKPPEPAPAAVKPPEPAKPAEPPAPKKVKIGDTEYTEEELALFVQGKHPSQQRQQPPEPPAQPQPKTTPEPPQRKAPTPEEVAAAEQKWVQERAQSFSANVDEGTLDTILGGGQQGAQTLKNLLAETYAKAHLESRKSIFNDLQQDFAQIQEMQQVVQQLAARDQHLTQITTEQLFVQKHPEFEQHMDIARNIGQSLVRKFPDIVNQLTQDQFIAEVARQTDAYLVGITKRIQPGFSSASWKAYVEQQKQAAEQAKAAAQAPPPAPPKPAAPSVPPPAANPPVAPPSRAPDNFQKSTAMSLRD